MTSRAQALLRQALTLAPEERADVTAELLASLDEPEPELDALEREWAAELERRARRALSSQGSGIPWDEVRRRADDDLSGQ